MTISKSVRVILPSEARTATPADIVLDDEALNVTNAELTNIHIIINVSAITDTPTIQADILALDPASGLDYTLLASAAISTVSTTVLKLGSSTDAEANLAVNTFIPRDIIVRVTHTDADEITYSIGVNAEYDSYQ